MKLIQKISSKFFILSIILITSSAILTWCNNNSEGSDSVQDLNNLAIQKDLQQQIDDLESQKTDFSFPSWVSELNISEPQGMILNQEDSYKTTEAVEWFNSIHFVYQWDYDNSMQQAELIANNADIPVSEEFKMAQDLIDNMQVDTEQMKELLGDMKWIVYTNYSLLESSNEDFSKAISVNEDGSLEIDVTDMIAMQNISNNFTK